MRLGVGGGKLAHDNREHTELRLTLELGTEPSAAASRMVTVRERLRGLARARNALERASRREARCGAAPLTPQESHDRFIPRAGPRSSRRACAAGGVGSAPRVADRQRRRDQQLAKSKDVRNGTLKQKDL